MDVRKRLNSKKLRMPVFHSLQLGVHAKDLCTFSRTAVNGQNRMAPTNLRSLERLDWPFAPIGQLFGTLFRQSGTSNSTKQARQPQGHSDPTPLVENTLA